MLRRLGALRALIALVAVAPLSLSACGGGDGGDDQGATGQSTTTKPAEPTTTTAAPTRKGEPISVPICDFLGISADEASVILGFTVTSTSAVGATDPTGGNCTLSPQAGASDAFEVTLAAFPDTEENFASFLERFTNRTAPSGGPLWTQPVEVPGIGDAAHTFKSPDADGGYDSLWVFTNGYRVLVNDKNTTDVPGAAGKLRSLAQEAASNV